jgi:hypothetical protein
VARVSQGGNSLVKPQPANGRRSAPARPRRPYSPACALRRDWNRHSRYPRGTRTVVMAAPALSAADQGQPVLSCGLRIWLLSECIEYRAEQVERQLNARMVAGREQVEQQTVQNRKHQGGGRLAAPTVLLM